MTKPLRTALLAAIAGVALSPAAARAADLNGSWLRDNARSTPAAYPTYWLTRVTPAPGFGANAPFTIEVRQDAGSLRVSDSVHPVRTYLLDGKAHGVKTDTMLAQASTTATAKGDTLTITTAQPWGGMPGNVASTETQTWSLSPDGKTLTIAMVRASPAQSQRFTEVYTRK